MITRAAVVKFLKRNSLLIEAAVLLVASVIGMFATSDWGWFAASWIAARCVSNALMSSLHRDNYEEVKEHSRRLLLILYRDRGIDATKTDRPSN